MLNEEGLVALVPCAFVCKSLFIGPVCARVVRVWDPNDMIFSSLALWLGWKQGGESNRECNGDLRILSMCVISRGKGAKNHGERTII